MDYEIIKKITTFVLNMYSLLKQTLMEFFSSDFWSENVSRVLATFGLSIAGTVSNAIPVSVAVSTQVPTTLSTLIDVFTLVSYGMSILVATTVIFRFHLWLKDRKKLKNK